jgi:lipopolysaccharide transport system ATP-binding protein
MSDIAIKVEGLSKRYRIGAQQQAYRTLREKLNDTALAPFRAAKHLLTRNGNGASGKGQAASRFPLTASRETFWALKDVSFEVKRGEVVGIIGRNGAGKSTLLKILSRITEPTEGFADIQGRVGSLLEVGTGFHPELTGRENIFLNGSILGMKRVEIKKKFDEMVAFAEIEKFIDTPVKYYSSGMYVRLAFAVAAHLEPQILLVDEVLAVGDIAFQKKCLNKMKEAGVEGKTSLVVSHNMETITRICERALWLHKGQVMFDGKVIDAVSAYEASTRANQDSNSNRLVRRPRPSQKAWVEWVEIKSDSNESRAVFENGEYMNLVTCIKGELPPASYFEWALFTERGQVATSGGTFFKESDIKLPTPSGLLRARIGPLPLAEGRYSLHLRLGELPGHNVMDVWEEVSTILISSNIPESGGLHFDIRRGIVYVPGYYSDGATSLK